MATDMGAQSALPSSSQLGRPLGTGRDWDRRVLLHHLPLALGSAALMLLFLAYSPSSALPQLDMGSGSPFPQEAAATDHGAGMTMGDGRSDTAEWTTATGYVATLFLGATLLIGPANLLLRRRNPVSTSLARDIGVWATIASIVHVVLGLQVHGNVDDVFNVVRYFLADGVPRTNSFGLGNWTGLAALVIVAGLFALSNDRSLRELKAERWKNYQRLNYALFALVVLHAYFYGALLRWTSLFTLVLFSAVIAVLAGQTLGIWLYRRRYARTGAMHA